MSTDLSVLTKDNQIVSTSKYGSESVFTDMAKAGDWLPRVQLNSFSTKAVQRGLLKAGTFTLHISKDNVQTLGEEFHCIPLSWRPKAVDTNSLQSFYNPASVAFKKVEEEAKKSRDSGCIFGPEFLLFIPQLNRFAQMMFSNVTMRNRAPLLLGLMGRSVTISAEVIENKKQQIWHGPVINECTMPLTCTMSQEEFLKRKAEVETSFNNPSEVGVEEVEVGTENKRER